MEPFHKKIDSDASSNESYYEREEENDDSLIVEEEKYQASIKLQHDVTYGVVTQMELDLQTEKQAANDRLANGKQGKKLSKTCLGEMGDATVGLPLTSANEKKIKSKKRKLKKLFHQLTEEVLLEMENEGRDLKRIEADSNITNNERLSLLEDCQDPTSEKQSFDYQNLENKNEDLIDLEGGCLVLSDCTEKDDENPTVSRDSLSFEKRSSHEKFFPPSEGEIPLDNRLSSARSCLRLDRNHVIKEKMVQFEQSRPYKENISVVLPSSKINSKLNLDGVKDKLVRFENSNSNQEKNSVEQNPSKVSFKLASEGIKDKLERFENRWQENNSLKHRPTRVNSKHRLEEIKSNFIYFEKNSNPSCEDVSLECCTSKPCSKQHTNEIKEKLEQFENRNVGKGEIKDEISIGSDSSFKSCHEASLGNVELIENVEADNLKIDTNNDIVNNDVDSEYILSITAEKREIPSVTDKQLEELPASSTINMLSENKSIWPPVHSIPSNTLPQDFLIVPDHIPSEEAPIKRNIGKLTVENVTNVSSDRQISLKTCTEEFDNEELDIKSDEKCLSNLKLDVAQIMSGLDFHTKQKQERKLQKLRELNDIEMTITRKLPLEFAYVSEHRLEEYRKDASRAATADEKIKKLRDLKVENFLKGILDVERSFHKELVSLNRLGAALETLNEVSAEWQKNPDAIINYNKLPAESNSIALCKLGAIEKSGNVRDVKSKDKGDFMGEVKDCEIPSKSPDSSFKFNVMAGDFK